MTSTRHYLDKIADKVIKFSEAKERTIKFLVKNEINDRGQIQNALIFSQIWCAHHLNERITMNDLMIYLGNDNDEPVDSDDIELYLDADMQQLSLYECLEQIL